MIVLIQYKKGYSKMRASFFLSRMKLASPASPASALITIRIPATCSSTTLLLLLLLLLLWFRCALLTRRGGGGGDGRIRLSAFRRRCAGRHMRRGGLRPRLRM